MRWFLLAFMVLIAPIKAADAQNTSPSTPLKGCANYATLNKEDKGKCLRKVLAVGQSNPGNVRSAFTETANDIAKDLVKVVAQAILNKAKSAAVSILAKQMAKALKCSVKKEGIKHPFNNTCKLIGTSPKQWLFAPQGVLEAFMSDLLQILDGLNSPGASQFKDVLELVDLDKLLADMIINWKLYKEKGVQEKLLQHLQKVVIKTHTSTEKCKEIPGTTTSGIVKRALWSIGKCIAEQGKNPGKGKDSVRGALFKKLATCQVKTYLSDCKVTTDKDKKTFHEGFTMVIEILKVTLENDMTKNEVRKQAAKQTLEIFFKFVGKQAAKTASKKALLDGVKTVMIGIIDKDWVSIAAGSLNVLLAAIKIQDEKTGFESKRFKKFLSVMTALSRYVSTYKKEGKEAHDSRVKIIESLMEEFSDRGEGLRGAVFSIGGSLSLFGGIGIYPKNSTPVTGSFAPSLKIGFAMQSYHDNHHGGWHLELGLLDLGNYVTLETVQLKDTTLDWTQIFSPSLTVGGWFWSRRTPMYAGLNFSVYPLANKGTVAFKTGVVFGVYIPILDFPTGG